MNRNPSWEPTASLPILQQRAAIISQIRDFFKERHVLEVETPLLCLSTVTDPHLKSVQGTVLNETLYLQTSPEYCMKRLLAAGSGSIFQICKAFRDEELGAIHQPEFTLLEWYRVGFDQQALMDEVADLLYFILHCEKEERVTYEEIFVRHLRIDPLSASEEELHELANEYGLKELQGDVLLDRDFFLQWLMSEGVEPHIGKERPCFVYDFPATQAALACLNPKDPRVGERFEVYFKGMELANGFHELRDPKEQRARFERDLKKREALGLPLIPMDEAFLSALSAGFPDCAGVALGLDRLILLATKQQKISQVMSFVLE